jgi:hypothetical protein
LAKRGCPVIRLGWIIVPTRRCGTTRRVRKYSRGCGRTASSFLAGGGSKSLVSLTELQIYTSGTGSQTTSNVASLGTLRYDLDGNGDNTVVFDASLNHGSGSGDAYIYIPFFAAQNSDFVYLYAAFGDAEGDVQAGFEEFALVHNVTPVPELSSFFPIIGLMVAVGSTSYLRKRKLAQTVA